MGCTHDCSSCSSDCKSKAQDLHEELNKYSSVKKVIGVVSGKGGVGKSLVTSMLAVTFNRLGKKTAVLDADITGPSIPKAFGVHERCRGNGEGIFPVVTETGIKMISVNLLLEHETDPVVWRSPVITGTVKQFWRMLSGRMSIICLLICLREQEMFRSLCSKACRLTALLLLHRRRSWFQ